MLPILVAPLHDPKGFLFPHLWVVEPLLKDIFSRAVMSITSVTFQNNQALVTRLQADPFFSVHLTSEAQVGNQFAGLFRQAVSESQSGQILHLCFMDRLVFILQSKHRDTFMREIQSLRLSDTPLLYSRSKFAWDTHPQNYCQIEKFSTLVGEYLFGKLLDFAWCHLAVESKLLEKALQQVHHSGLSMLAEITLGLMETLRMKDVDWLEWEDPFLLGRDAGELRSERERSRIETEKRLAYILPTIQTLLDFKDGSGQ